MVLLTDVYCISDGKSKRLRNGFSDKYFIVVEGRYQCKLCASVIKDRRGTQVHFAKIHKNALFSGKIPENCLCDLCGKHFRNPPSLHTHKAKMHGIYSGTNFKVSPRQHEI